MRVKWSLLPSQTTESLPESPTLAPTGGAHFRFRFRLSAASCFLCKPNWQSHQGSGGHIKKSHIEGGASSALRDGSKHFIPDLDNSLLGRLTPNVPALSSTFFPLQELSSAWQGHKDLGGAIQIVSCCGCYWHACTVGAGSFRSTV